jgi:hypothetical protein
MTIDRLRQLHPRRPFNRSVSTSLTVGSLTYGTRNSLPSARAVACCQSRFQIIVEHVDLLLVTSLEELDGKRRGTRRKR